MKRTAFFFAFMAIIFLSFPLSANEGGMVLWWMVGEDYGNITATTMDGTGTVTANELNVTDMRVRYESDDASDVGYLSFWSVEADNSVAYYDGSSGMGGQLGSGLPSEYFGDLSSLSGTAYSFVVEFGNYKDGSWTGTSMQTDKVKYSDLLAAGHIAEWSHDPQSLPNGYYWSPSGFTVVPEPTSGFLALVGVALLALRRGRRV
jgi:MYXO-CTERM domain-containing protein